MNLLNMQASEFSKDCCTSFLATIYLGIRTSPEREGFLCTDNSVDLIKSRRTVVRVH
jgi:hypothetical protein